MNSLIPGWLARDIEREEERRRQRIAALAEALKRSGRVGAQTNPVVIPIIDDEGDGPE